MNEDELNSQLALLKLTHKQAKDIADEHESKRVSEMIQTKINDKKKVAKKILQVSFNLSNYPSDRIPKVPQVPFNPFEYTSDRKN